jgi:hypothetical protein
MKTSRVGGREEKPKQKNLINHVLARRRQMERMWGRMRVKMRGSRRLGMGGQRHVLAM